MNKSDKKTIAIMQPTFLPWIGYFAMIDQVDEFVFLDSVQFAKRSWQQRNRIKCDNGEQMLSVSVLTKGRSKQLIKDVEINPDDLTSKKIRNSIKQYYSKAPFFSEFFPLIEECFLKEHTKLVDLNVDLIKAVMGILKISTSKLSFSSEHLFSTSKAELLADICVHKGYMNYLSAPGSKEYIEESGIFKKREIDVVYQNYDHPSYNQLNGDFIPYMCILDLLFNEGNRSIDIIRSGLK